MASRLMLKHFEGRSSHFEDLPEVSDFLQMDGPPVPHQSLMERGLLYAWQPGGG